MDNDNFYPLLIELCKLTIAYSNGEGEWEVISSTDEAYLARQARYMENLEEVCKKHNTTLEIYNEEFKSRFPNEFSQIDWKTFNYVT